MAYAYKRSITIDHTQVPSTQSSYAVLVKLDSSNAGTTMKTVGNGGHIQNTGTQSGGNPVTMPFDLIFTSDSGGTTKIPWEIDSYNGTSGVLWAWVFVSSVSSSSDTVIYMFYDDAGVNTQQNTSSLAPSNVWDSNYVGVYHLPDGTTLLMNDSTSNALNGTGENSPTAIAGQIDGAVALNGTNQDITLGTHAAFTLAGSNLTLEAWIYNSGTANSLNRIFDRADGGAGVDGFSWDDEPGFYVNGAGVSPSGNYLGNVWNGLAITYDNAHVIFYSNGSAIGSPMALSTAIPNTSTTATIGNWGIGAGRNWVGNIDEVRISKIARSADYVTTSYNNQNNPESFAVVGSEIPIGGGSNILKVSGVARASISKISGVALASISKVSGVSN